MVAVVRQDGASGMNQGEMRPGPGGFCPAFRIAVVCVCGYVSGIILKRGIETVAREQDALFITVEARDFRGPTAPPGDATYDAVFCMSGLKSRVAASFPPERILEVTNIFDLQELRTLLDQALARCSHSGSSSA